MIPKDPKKIKDEIKKIIIENEMAEWEKVTLPSCVINHKIQPNGLCYSKKCVFNKDEKIAFKIKIMGCNYHIRAMEYHYKMIEKTMGDYKKRHHRCPKCKGIKHVQVTTSWEIIIDKDGNLKDRNRFECGKCNEKGIVDELI